MTIEEALRTLEEWAQRRHDGHLTLMRFTTGWKVMLGTPDMTPEGREEVQRLRPYATLDDMAQRLEAKCKRLAVG
jgi:hypothetical protein